MLEKIANGLRRFGLFLVLPGLRSRFLQEGYLNNINDAKSLSQSPLTFDRNIPLLLTIGDSMVFKKVHRLHSKSKGKVGGVLKLYGETMADRIGEPVEYGYGSILQTGSFVEVVQILIRKSDLILLHNAFQKEEIMLGQVEHVHDGSIVRIWNNTSKGYRDVILWWLSLALIASVYLFVQVGRLNEKRDTLVIEVDAVRNELAIAKEAVNAALIEKDHEDALRERLSVEADYLSTGSIFADVLIELTKALPKDTSLHRLEYKSSTLQLVGVTSMNVPELANFLRSQEWIRSVELNPSFNTNIVIENSPFDFDVILRVEALQ